MDLGRCPKCGVEWTPGYEKCLECGFVAIGAGLKNLPKKVKPKPKKYEEPGSWGPFIRGSLVMSLLYFVAVERPWANSWSYVRTITGEPMPYSVDGDWDIARAVQTKKGNTVFVRRPYTSARAVFRGGKVVFIFATGSGSKELVGSYVQKGDEILVTDVSAQASSFDFPKELTMRLANSDDSSAMLTVNENESVTFVKRRSPNAPSMALAQFDSTNGAMGMTMVNTGVQG